MYESPTIFHCRYKMFDLLRKSRRTGEDRWYRAAQRIGAYIMAHREDTHGR